MFSTVNRHSIKDFKRAHMQMTDTSKQSEEANDLAEAKRNSIKNQNSTANHFFGEPTGAKDFYDCHFQGFSARKL